MADPVHILIAEARFYDDVADELVEGAKAVLEEAGATYETVAVPGAYELPAAVRMAVESGQFDGYIALGCVIRGETSHYDYVCGESARGLMALSTRHGIALAWARASRAEKDKGAVAARACLDMVALRRAFVPEAD